ncbi:MAG: DUF881 domain-containing protein [Clostridium sp.]
MKISEGKILLLLTGILSGMLLVVFILNSSSQAYRPLTYNQYKEYQITANSLKAENRNLYKKYYELEEKIEKYQAAGEKANEKVKREIKDELEYLRLFYGSTEVVGDGVTITLDDKRQEDYSNNLEVERSVVHNVDLYEVVNELRDAGVEAIAINGYRVVAQSTITCEGPTIMIDGNNIVPPFEIDVIGDPSAIEFTLASQENTFGRIKLRGLKLSQKAFEDKTLPAYNSNKHIKYMKELREGSGK